MSSNEQKKVDIVLYSLTIKKYLKLVFKGKNLKPSDVVKDANERGMKTITKEKLSRYLNNDVPVLGFPTQRDILWLCARYSIKVKLKVSLVEESEKDALLSAEQIKEA